MESGARRDYRASAVCVARRATRETAASKVRTVVRKEFRDHEARPEHVVRTEVLASPALKDSPAQLVPRATPAPLDVTAETAIQPARAITA
jgi:hypothetical protein